MAARMMILYQTPEDPAVFEERYLREHLPLLSELHGFDGIDIYRVRASPAEGFPYAYVLTGTCETVDAWLEMIVSEEAGWVFSHADELAGDSYGLVLLERLDPDEVEVRPTITKEMA